MLIIHQITVLISWQFVDVNQEIIIFKFDIISRHLHEMILWLIKKWAFMMMLGWVI
jgi:hypothetical protein